LPNYLVTAIPRPGKLVKLRRKLELGDIALMRGFGESLDSGLKNAKRSADGAVYWEQESDSEPPLSQEKRAILNEFFREIATKVVVRGQGWDEVKSLPPLWPWREPG
jgi:hypothetical protein